MFPDPIHHGRNVLVLYVWDALIFIDPYDIRVDPYSCGTILTSHTLRIDSDRIGLTRTDSHPSSQDGATRQMNLTGAAETIFVQTGGGQVVGSSERAAEELAS